VLLWLIASLQFDFLSQGNDGLQHSTLVDFYRVPSGQFPFRIHPFHDPLNIPTVKLLFSKGESLNPQSSCKLPKTRSYNYNIQ